MSNIVISVENLSKSYRLGQIGTGTLSRDLEVWWAKVRGKPNPLLKIGQTDHGNQDGQTLWALQDVSFQVQQGEVLGIIGRNGAGKSTLLKILSRVTAPTSGQVKVKGRIASLLEVGTGFHPELTGRENIFLNGAILGMSRQEVQRKFDEIVSFAEVEKFVDTPVKRYSSGMYVRLAFAVAAHLESEILLVDEVLAVGDAEFQKKALGKMGKVATEGRTVLFVSHNMTAVKSLCNKVMTITNGEYKESGIPELIIHNYLSPSITKGKNGIIDLTQSTNRSGSGLLKFESCWIKDHLLEQKNIVICGHKSSVFMKYFSTLKDKRTFDDVCVTVVIHDFYGRPVIGGSTYYSNSNFNHIPDAGIIECNLGELFLMPDHYRLMIRIAIKDEPSDYFEDACSFEVTHDDIFKTGKFPDKKHGVMVSQPVWKIIPNYDNKEKN